MAGSRRTFAAAALLIAITFACFWGVSQNGFIGMDDPVFVSGNATVKAGITWPGIVQVFTTVPFTYWQPVAFLSHMADVELFGVDAGAHHLVNLVLHCLNAALLFLALLRLTGAMYRSLLVAAIFALHPMHVEPVAWIASRKDVLSGFFFIAGLMAYSWYNDRRTVARYGGVLLLFALGLMTKPHIMGFPVVLMLLDVWPLRRKMSESFVEKIPLFALAAVSAMVALSTIAPNGQLSNDHHVHIPAAPPILMSIVHTAQYLPKFLWPDPLSIFYISNYGLWQSVWSIAAIAGGTIAALLLRRRADYVLVGWFWFLVMLLPTVSLLVADRFSYLPFIGLSIVVVWAAAEVGVSRPAAPKAFAALALLVLADFGIAVKHRVGVWRSTDSLLRASLFDEPSNYQIHFWVGSSHLQAGRYEEAIEEFQQSLRERPRYFQAEMSCAQAFLKSGLTDEAMRHYANAMRLRPEDPAPYKEIGDLLMNEARLREAVGYYRKAAALHFADANRLANLIQSVEATIPR